MAPDDFPSIAVLDSCATQDRDFLADRIDEFNVGATGVDDGRELAILLREPAGSIVAGLYGWTWGGVCEIASLWVTGPLRGRGFGTALLQAAEAEARNRSVRSMILNTHTFQAPEFYAKQGYTVAGRCDDYPAGHAKLLLTKDVR